MLELLFSRNKDEIISGDGKGKEKHNIWEKRHLIPFKMSWMLIADTVMNTDQCAYSVSFNDCNKMKVN